MAKKLATNRVTKSPQVYRATVVYHGGLNMTLDKQLEKLAKTFGGSDIGSGYFFMNEARDIEFEFKDEAKRNRAVKVLKAKIKEYQKYNK